jgi:ATP-dependent DNA helicase RecG
MRETNDGFPNRRGGLRLRGPGEILGTRQSGEEVFRVATTPTLVAELAPIAQSDAQLLLDRDARPRQPARPGSSDLPLSVRAATRRWA